MNPPLFAAARGSHLAVVNHLFVVGAEISASLAQFATCSIGKSERFATDNSVGDRPLHMASCHGFLGLVEHLLVSRVAEATATKDP